MVVRSEDFGLLCPDRGLPESAGENASLKPNGDFRQRPHPSGDAYLDHMVRDIFRALPAMPKPARPFAYNLIEQFKSNILASPPLGDHPLQRPARLISRQLGQFEQAMKSKAA